MAAFQEDFIFGDDLEAILAAIEDNLLENDTGFTGELTTVTEEIGESEETAGSCDYDLNHSCLCHKWLS